MTHETSRSSAVLQRVGMALLISSLIVAGYALVQSPAETASAGGARLVTTSTLAEPAVVAPEAVAPQIVAAPAQDDTDDTDEAQDAESEESDAPADEEEQEQESTEEVTVKVKYVGAETNFEVEVVTALPLDKGDDVDNGDLVLEVSSRPIFVFEGAQPAVRTLAAGTVGDDVNQLERALTALGYNVGTVDDHFDAATGNAVAAFYADRGYDLPAAQEKDLEDLAKAQADLAEARADREVLVIDLRSENEPDLVEANEDLRALQEAEADVAASEITLAELRTQREPLDFLNGRFTWLRSVIDVGLLDGSIDPDDPESVSAEIAAELRSLVNDDPDDFDTFREMFDELDQEHGKVLEALFEVVADIEKELLDRDLALTDVDLAWDTIYEVPSTAKIDEIRAKLKATDVLIAGLETELGRAGAKVGARMSIDEFVFVPNLPGEIDDVEVDERDDADGTLLKIVTG